jgi:hypothetical protein
MCGTINSNAGSRAPRATKQGVRIRTRLCESRRPPSIPRAAAAAAASTEYGGGRLLVRDGARSGLFRVGSQLCARRKLAFSSGALRCARQLAARALTMPDLLAVRERSAQVPVWAGVTLGTRTPLRAARAQAARVGARALARRARTPPCSSAIRARCCASGSPLDACSVKCRKSWLAVMANA